MDVHLLIYDLSRGMARQMSMGFLGFQLDAIYHTSIELQGREYVYDGGIIAIAPGSSHLGQPMERLHLGKTELDMVTIEEYLDSIRPIFTLQAYDLFRHNCNNFTDSFSEFLLGKGIPSYISSMPQAVMDSPMGRMLLPHLAQGVNGNRQSGSILGLQQSSQAAPAPIHKARVGNISSAADLSRALEKAKTSSAVIFFTSATCPPCKTLYPMYDQLAEELEGKTVFIKVDISQPQAREAAARFSIRATPTFITFLKGEQENAWSGADPAKLRGNLQLLAKMAFPKHLHASLNLPTFAATSVKPVLYTKVPPMDKLISKMGEDMSQNQVVKHLRTYIEAREKSGPQNATLPDLSHLSEFVETSITTLPLETLFATVDLFRCALVDPRISGYFAEQKEHETLRKILDRVNNSECPYALRLVALQMACNLFSTPLFSHAVMKQGAVLTSLTQLVSSSFLDEGHNNVRVAASSLLFNLAAVKKIAKGTVSLPEEEQVELAAAVVEAIGQETSSVEALHGMLLALGHLFYNEDLDGELADLLRALDAEGTVMSKKEMFPTESLITEVGSELLGKGLRKP